MNTESKRAFCVLVLAFLAAAVLAQEKVAEGEYQVSPLHAGAPPRHWVLLTRPDGGYLLRSEIQSPKNGTRVLQIEELDEQFVPSNIGYELYLKEQTKPNVIVSCTFLHDSITCDGQSEKGKAKPSRPYEFQGPFLFAVRDLPLFDFPWLMSGALNMARLTSGRVPLRTIRVTGGAALELTDDINIAALQAVMGPDKVTAIRPQRYTEWEFTSNDEHEEMLAFIANEDVKVGGITLEARHYSLTSGDLTMHFWLASPGLLVRMTAGKDVEYILANYRQYKELIPQIKPDESSKDPEKLK